MTEYTLEHYEYIKGLHKRIAELENDKAELVDALETVWGAVTYWQGDDWVEDLIDKHQQPAKEQGKGEKDVSEEKKSFN
jgi:hypothetical protein